MNITQSILVDIPVHYVVPKNDLFCTYFGWLRAKMIGFTQQADLATTMGTFIANKQSILYKLPV